MTPHPALFYQDPFNVIDIEKYNPLPASLKKGMFPLRVAFNYLIPEKNAATLLKLKKKRTRIFYFKIMRNTITQTG